MREPTGALTVLRSPRKLTVLRSLPKADRLRSWLELTISRSLKKSAHSVAGQIQRAREPVTAHPPKPCPAIISLGQGKRQCSGKK
jgi:hypothetical protein